VRRGIETVSISWRTVWMVCAGGRTSEVCAVSSCGMGALPGGAHEDANEDIPVGIGGGGGTAGGSGE